MPIWKKILVAQSMKINDGKKFAEKARELDYQMFEWNDTVYAVAPLGAEWNSLPLFESKDVN